MACNSNRLIQFWKELKRRKVISVIPVYAVAAFVILQVADMVREPLHLPPWTMSLLIIILGIGFILAVILAWAYDISPKGIDKTVLTEKAIEQKQDIPLSDKPLFYEKSIVVLPFENISSDPDQGYFCDGITEEIINTLTHIEKLKVIARTTSFTFKNKYEDVRSVGKSLGVETILEGSLRKSGDKLRITAQLIRVSDGFHIWSEKFDREMKDIFEIQDEISLAIVKELKIQLLEEEKGHILKSDTLNIKAYNYYLKGRFYWNNNRSKEGIETTIRNFEQAIECDPDYALAYAGLALAYTVLADWGYIQTKKAIKKIKELSDKAGKLDNTLAENHCSLIYSYALFEWNWQKAEIESKKAFELNPKSSEVHHFYALFQMCLGNLGNAIEHNKLAREIDPLSSVFNFAFGLILYMSRQFDASIGQFRKTLSIDKSFSAAYFWASFSYLQKKKYAEAIEEYQNFYIIPDMADVTKRWLCAHTFQLSVIQAAQ